MESGEGSHLSEKIFVAITRKLISYLMQYYRALIYKLVARACNHIDLQLWALIRVAFVAEPWHLCRITDRRCQRARSRKLRLVMYDDEGIGAPAREAGMPRAISNADAICEVHLYKDQPKDVLDRVAG